MAYLCTCIKVVFYKILNIGFLRLILLRVTDIIKHFFIKIIFSEVPLLSHSVELLFKSTIPESSFCKAHSLFLFCVSFYV